MGDKSPKSKQKNQKQNQSKSNSIANEKKRAIESKQVTKALPKKK